MDDFARVCKERQSIRRYLPGRVPKTILEEILDEARWSPSWGNTQSTPAYVISGDALERFKKSLLESALSEAPGCTGQGVATPA